MWYRILKEIGFRYIRSSPREPSLIYLFFVPKVFQIKWTRETRPDILDNVGVRPRYFELPPRGSMGSQRHLVSQEEVPEGFFVETYTEEEVVATGERYSPNETGQHMQMDNQDIEIVQQVSAGHASLSASLTTVY